MEEDDVRKHCELVCEYLPSVVVRKLHSFSEEETDEEGLTEDVDEKNEEEDDDVLPSSSTINTVVAVVNARGLGKIGSYRVADADVLSAKGTEIDWYEETFKSIADVMHSYGGDLLDMDAGGDTMVFAWSDDPIVGNFETNARKAVTALLEVVKRRGRESSESKRLQSISGSVCGGKMEIVFTGDVASERSFFVLRGGAYDEAVGAAREARDDDVVVGASLRRSLEAIFGTPARTTRSGGYVLNGQEAVAKGSLLPTFSPRNLYKAIHDVDDENLEQLEGEMMFFVPPPILQALHFEGPGQEKWNNERRMEVSVLLARVSLASDGATNSAAVDVAILHDTVRRTLLIVESFGGCVLNLRMSGTDLCVFSAFGLPTELHEDDPERAVLAAMKLRATLDKRPTFTAITTGPVFCGCVGCGNSKRYTILGTTVQRACRLMGQSRRSGIMSRIGVVCDVETYEVAMADGELEFQRVDEIAGEDGVKLYTPNVAAKGDAAKVEDRRNSGMAWFAACGEAFRAQLRHRRDVWNKRTHKSMAVDPSVVDAVVEFVPRTRGTTTLAKEILDWYASTSRGLKLFSLEGGLGHGKSAILQHTVAHVAQRHKSLQLAYIDADPLNTSGEKRMFSSFASILYDVFVREGRRTAAEIERQIVQLLTASGSLYKTLIPWLAILNPIFPVNFAFRSDDCRALAGRSRRENDPSGPNTEMMEATQRAVMIGIVWALARKAPLLLCVDDALDMDAKSWDVVQDLVKSGANIINEYNVLNPGIAEFLIKECTSKSKSAYDVCVVLAMHKYEDVREHLSPDVSTTLSMVLGDSTEMDNPFTRLLVPLLTKEQTSTLFVKELRRGMFPKLRALDANGADKVYEHSEGNPLFVAEIAHELMEAYKLNPKVVRFEGRDGEILRYDVDANDLDLPPNLELKLGKEVDHQHLAAQIVLKLVAKANRALSFAEIYHAFPLRHLADDLPSEIEHLIEEELLHDVSARKTGTLSKSSHPLLEMKFWFTTEFLHHTIHRRLLIEQQRDLNALLNALTSRQGDMSVPEHVFQDHSCSTEWGGGWGAEEIWRRHSAKRSRQSRISSS